MSKLNPVLIFSSLCLSILCLSLLDAQKASAEHGAKDAPAQVKPTDAVDDKTPNKDADGELKPVINPTMAEVRKYYSAGNYRAVLAALNKMKPTMMGHYYKGLAHQGVNQNYKAAIEYNYVRTNAINPQLKYNATRALSSLYKQKKRANSTRWFKNKYIEDEYQRYSEYGGTEAQMVDRSDHARKARARERLRRPDQDRNWKRYNIPQSQFKEIERRKARGRGRGY